MVTKAKERSRGMKNVIRFLVRPQAHVIVPFLWMTFSVEGHPTAYFSKSWKNTFKQLNNKEEQQNNGFWTFNFWKRYSFFQASWPVFPFLASLAPKRNTFCENQNVDFNQITYYSLNITVHNTIASKFYQFRTNYSHYLLLSYLKKCSSNCSNLQARTNFLTFSKPAGNWWEHLIGE